MQKALAGETHLSSRLFLEADRRLSSTTRCTLLPAVVGSGAGTFSVSGTIDMWVTPCSIVLIRALTLKQWHTVERGDGVPVNRFGYRVVHNKRGRFCNYRRFKKTIKMARRK